MPELTLMVFNYEQVEAAPNDPSRTGGPMLRAALPFPAVAHRTRGATTLAWFGHNTTVATALHVLREGHLRPSTFACSDDSWIPSAAFYARGSVHSLARSPTTPVACLDISDRARQQACSDAASFPACTRPNMPRPQSTSSQQPERRGPGECCLLLLVRCTWF